MQKDDTNSRLTVLIFTSVFIILSINNTSFANSAYAGHLNIYVKNAPSGYILDILIKQDLRLNNEKGFEKIKNSPLYNYDKDGWCSAAKWSERLFPDNKDLTGNFHWKTGLRIHKYKHRVLPNSIKIALQLPDNTLKISKEIKIKSLTTDLLFDASTAGITVLEAPEILLFDHNIYSIIVAVAMCLLLTLLIEGAWALVFLGKKGFWSIPVNVITQVIMHSVLITMFYGGMRSEMGRFTFVFEVIVPFVEAFLYKAFLKDNFSTKKLIVMSILANISSFYVGIAIGI
ncbi:MAG: hypothetical protein ACOYWZ_05450 [Bacillota bacterium]